jgi:hypothetical protein
VQSTRQVQRSSPVHLRAIVAAMLALGLVLAIATLAWAAPSLSIGSGPSGPTSDVTPSFGFAADPGATVECSIDHGTPDYGPCTTATSHTAAAQLPDGDYVFHVRATDDLQEQTEASQSFSVDTVDPALDVVSGPPGPTTDTAPTFGFAAEAGATVECSIDQGAPAYGPCTSGTTHAPGAPLPDGGYTFRVRATDAAGNQASAQRTFSVDTAAPSPSIGSGPSGPTRDATPSFGFTVSDASPTSVECSVDQGTAAYVPCTSATSHNAAALADGSYVFRVRATDAVGHQAETSRAFRVDTAAPAVGGISGPSGPTNDRTPSFGFTVSDASPMNVECSVDHGTAAYGPCTTATSHTAGRLADGSYVFRVRATDAAGNQTVRSQAFVVDSEAPSLTLGSGPPEPTNDSTPSFEFTAEAGTTVECSIDQATPPFGPCTSAATYVVGTPLSDGTHVFRVRARDGVGNDAVVSFTFTVDTVPPVLAIGFGPSGTTGDSTPLFGFTAEAGTTVQCSIDQGTPAYGPCASATTHAAVAPLSDGAYVFRVRATDRAGNATSATRAFTVETVPQRPGPESPRQVDPTPTATIPLTPTPSAPRLLSPFPLVRIAGTLTPTGARIRLLSVRASPGTLVRVTVRPACSRRRDPARRCHVLQAAGTVGRSALIGFRGLERAYRSGTVIVVRVWRADRIGKYTRFTLVRGKSPRRVDQCLVPEATRGSRCPSA